MIEENLPKLGFSPSEIKIYLHLLRNGNSYPNRISAETKINRTNVYEALDRLVYKGVVSFIVRNKVKWFETKSPDSLFLLIQAKEEEFKQTKSDIFEDIKNLKQIKPDKRPLEANVFIGKKGLRMIFEDILIQRKSIFLIAAELQFRKFFGPYFELWHKKRVEARLHQRTIFPHKLKGKLEKRRFLEYRFVDYKFMNPATTIIYGNTCVFIQWSREPLAIKINNKEIAKSHLNYFNMLWNS